MSNGVRPFHPPDPPGQWIRLRSDDLKPAHQWRDTEPIVATDFFYWYDVDSDMHFLNPDGSDALVDHPSESVGYSFKNADWWARELRDVAAAGIDFIAPVYWGVPGQYVEGPFQWSFEGLAHLVDGWTSLEAEGMRPPAVALFYDTTTLQHNGEDRHIDLTTEDGKAWFYTTIRDFFCQMPPRMWAMREGGPIVFLYSGAFPKAQDPAAFDYVASHFEEDFACRPYVVRERSWRAESQAEYAWGGALGFKDLQVASLGPGYDHHAVPDKEPLIAERRGGDFYRENWEELLAKPVDDRATIVMVETWNELHEGTDVCDTVEFGRQYIEITAEYADRFKRSG